MQFVKNGPDIPESLLQAHEGNRVVFFCGAGISYPAGLPGFKGLVKKVYRNLGTRYTPVEKDAYKARRYDATIDFLEGRFPGGPIAVRRALAKALIPKLSRKGAIDTHIALLQLARNREGVVKLVTTNFDRIFQVAMKRSKIRCNTFVAPLLPIPKNSRWNGLVYLHGLLPAKSDDEALHRLVISSGDFGLAYLTERWASRFVSDLFSNYVVCFVGYSIEDPVLRYMMDALAADRRLGELIPQAYALGSCKAGEEENKEREWLAKGVTPILYTTSERRANHLALHRTLKAWAETYRDGILGKEKIVMNYASAKPSDSTCQDDFVGRMMWALSDVSGLPAKLFSEFTPVPSIEWLVAFSEKRFQERDLYRFGVPTIEDENSDLLFSMVNRPAKHGSTPFMALVSEGFADTQWDEVMLNIAKWLLRYLNSTTLILWLSQNGGKLHSHFSLLIELEIERFARLEKEGKQGELDEIRTKTPDAIPSSLMHTLWRLYLSGRIKGPWKRSVMHQWMVKLRRYGLTTSLRLELRKLLAPQVSLSEPFRWSSNKEINTEPSTIRELVDWEIELATDHAQSYLVDDSSHAWQEASPVLLDDFQQLLLDTLGLFHELGDADELKDSSFWDLPSISPHRQNMGFSGWVPLIELLRDSWLETKKREPGRASGIAKAWFALPYPTFKRLALFAASHDDCVDCSIWVGWLLAEDALWLWSIYTHRETMRLLVLQGRNLNKSVQSKLEAAILAGPPRQIYRNDLNPEELDGLTDRSVWLHLAKLKSSGITLGIKSKSRLATLSASHLAWKLAENESDEFSHWMSGTGDPDFEESRIIEFAPRDCLGLAKWLKKPIPNQPMSYDDNWKDICRKRFCHSLCALNELSQEDVWPTERWKEALQVWSEDRVLSRSWRYAAPLVNTMPDYLLQDIAYNVTWWMEKASKSTESHRGVFLSLGQRMINLLSVAPETEEDNKLSSHPVNRAINHPIGHITEVLLNQWFKSMPNDNDGLPISIEPLFSQMCNIEVKLFRNSRVLLARRLIAFYRVDRSWTEKYLMPLFDWTANPNEAPIVWQGFLTSPRMYLPLLSAIKPQLLEAAKYYPDLHDLGRQYASFLTYMALDFIDGYKTEEYTHALELLPNEGIQAVAQALVQALEGAGDQREEFWENRIHPFWQKIWPKTETLVTNGISVSLALLSIAARRKFPQAMKDVQDWLVPIEHPYLVVHKLHKSGLCSSFPPEALLLLDKVIENQRWGPRELKQCCDEIALASSELKDDSKFQKLELYIRQFVV